MLSYHLMGAVDVNDEPIAFDRNDIETGQVHLNDAAGTEREDLLVTRRDKLDLRRRYRVILAVLSETLEVVMQVHSECRLAVLSCELVGRGCTNLL